MTRQLAVMLGVSMCVTACAKPANYSDADRRTNRELLTQWLRHLDAKNWDSLSLLYTEDATVMPPNGPAVHGRAAIRAWMGSYPPISRFTAVDDTISGNGDLAYARGRYHLTLALEGSPSDSGKFVEIRRRQPDGSWKLEVDIFNSDVPLPPAAPPPARH